MKKIRFVLPISYLIVSSVTVLIMLVTSFEQFQEKYLPSFLAAQKFVLPIVLSAMAVAYLFFFEPDRLAQKKTLVVMRIAMMITLGLFSYYISTVTVEIVSGTGMALFIAQWLMIAIVTGFFFRKHR